ncbi:cTAGE family member 2-like [Cavia porcellus]|uniref:cTAGE family member 2-like n=1 Tax=Cavia porcellus TaxID=10141 RepID=UPI002FE1491F
MEVATLITNKKWLQREKTDALSENVQLHKNQSQLSQEAQQWKEQVGELTSQKRALQDSQAEAEQLLREKGKPVKALPQCLLINTKGWASEIPKHITQPENSQQEIKTQLENGPGSGHQPTVPLEKLVYGARLNASLNSMEEQRNQLRTQLWEAKKNKKELAESLQHLQTQQASLKGANAQLQGERQKLQQKLTVMAEVHHQTMLSGHTKLRHQATAWAEQEKKLSIREKEGDHTAQELETYRKIAQDMQEELEKTINFYQRQVTYMQKEAHEIWERAATAERLFRELRMENALTKQILCAMEVKASLLSQDPATLSVIKSAPGREHSQRGPSLQGRPA